MEAHVGGFMRRTPPSEELADAIRRVAKGQHFLDPDLVASALDADANPLTRSSGRSAEPHECVDRVASEGPFLERRTPRRDRGRGSRLSSSRNELDDGIRDRPWVVDDVEVGSQLLDDRPAQ